MTVIYEPGQIRVSSWHRVLARRDIEVWSIDCDSKYTSWFTLGSTLDGGQPPELWLLADERTIKLDPVLTRPSIFSWPYGKGWDILSVEGGRYEVRVCLWKPRRRAPAVDRAYLLVRALRSRLRALRGL